MRDEDLDDYIIEQHIKYLEKCKCTDKDDCNCMRLPKFSEEFIKQIEQEDTDRYSYEDYA